MPRINYPTNISDPRVQYVVERMPALNLIRLESHAEGCLEAIMRLSDGVLNRTIVAPEIKIVAFLHLCEVVGSPYEFEQLRKVAVNYKLPDSMIEASRAGTQEAGLSREQALACRLSAELAVSPRCTDETYDALLSFLSPRELCELIIGIGFYMMQSRVIETFEIEIENPPAFLPPPVVTDEIQAWRDGRA